MSDLMHHIGCRKEDVGSFVILTENAEDCEKIAALLESPKQVARNREYKTITGKLNGKAVSVTSCGIGSPSAAIAIEELAQCGIKTLIRIGIGIAIEPNASDGDIMIASSGVKMDGTSAEYVVMDFPAISNYTVNVALEQEAIKQLGKGNFKIGIVEGRDVFRRRTDFDRTLVSQESILERAWRKGGVLCSDMETAAVLVVTRYLGVRASSVNLVSDNKDADIMPCAKLAVGAIRRLMDSDKISSEFCLLT